MIKNIELRGRGDPPRVLWSLERGSWFDHGDGRVSHLGRMVCKENVRKFPDPSRELGMRRRAIGEVVRWVIVMVAFLAFAWAVRVFWFVSIKS